ncbi:siroheme synthase [Vibrionales bacterium C3R12]|nr:siroheme synthase [Vibrionales bacterium C3R12]
MRYFPLFLDVVNKPVLVVGGGEVACRKVDSLLRAGASVTVVSPKLEPYLRSLVDAERCSWIQNFYSSEIMTKQYIQVWATTDNPSLNHQVHKDAKKMGILVNVVDDLPFCDFITPSMVNRGRIQIAISSGGASPILVRNIREKLESVLPQNLSLLAEFGASKRNSIKKEFPSVTERRKFWEAFLSDSRVESSVSREQLESLYQIAIKQELDRAGSCTWIEFGDDVELLTIKALRLMQQAELILYPKACPYDFIDLSRRDAEREQYATAADLSERIAKAKQDNLRICVFVPKKNECSLLIGSDSLLSLGRC